MSLAAIEWNIVVSLIILITTMTMLTIIVRILIKTFGHINRQTDAILDDLSHDIASLHERFDTINQYLAENHENIQDIKDRLKFLEAYNTFTMAIRSHESNPRSEGAKEMWKKRKQKGLEKKDG